MSKEKLQKATTVAGAFEAMGELFTDSPRWTQGYYARDAQGKMTESDKPEAVCFCLMGAHNLIEDNETRYAVNDAMVKSCRLMSKKHGSNVVEFNDDKATTIDDIREFVEINKQLAQYAEI
jgi:U3 small nucleolar RNA-associated protein 14